VWRMRFRAGNGKKGWPVVGMSLGDYSKDGEMIILSWTCSEIGLR